MVNDFHIEMPRRGDDRRGFTVEVRETFARLTRQGLGPNDAAALALKLAAGIAEWPLDVPAFLGSIERCKDATLRSGEKLSEHLGVSDDIERVFSSADALNSSFIAHTSARQDDEPPAVKFDAMRVVPPGTPQMAKFAREM